MTVTTGAILKIKDLIPGPIADDHIESAHVVP